MRSWSVFSASIRKIVDSARVIVEVLEAVMDGDERLLKLLIKENASSAKSLRKFIAATKRAERTVGGRFEIDRLIDDYRFEAHWPTDDITLRRVYDLYRRGELGKRLPDVQRRIA